MQGTMTAASVFTSTEYAYMIGNYKESRLDLSEMTNIIIDLEYQTIYISCSDARKVSY